MKLVANPVKYSATPVQYNLAPPRLGQHTDEVLSSLLGYDESMIRAASSVAE